MKKAIQLVMSLAITGGCFWWTFKDIHWPEMWASLSAANYWWLVPYFLVLSLIHLCRVLRWGSLLSGLERVPFRPLNEASAIGFMMLIILPFRLGEFARPFLIAQRSKIRRSSAMTSVVLERIIDGISIAVLLRTCLFFIPKGHSDLQHLRWGANLMFAVFGGGLAFLLFATWQEKRTVELIRATLGRVSPAYAVHFTHMVEGFVGAMRALPKGRDLYLVFGYTAAYWALNGFGMSLLTRAFDCTGTSATAACVPMSLNFFQGLLVLSVLVVGLMIPAAPGSAGTFQAFVVIGLSVFLPKEVVSSSGIAFANVLWVAQICQLVLFGLLFLLLSRQTMKGITQNLAESEMAPSGGS